MLNWNMDQHKAYAQELERRAQRNRLVSEQHNQNNEDAAASIKRGRRR